uniref:TraB domain-containing protein n=1 Tax=Tetraselmis chuii TaxID=63592 RepID=A0A7S1T7C2_9CHLO|mmetsp:Transcript_7816/g.14036  ORF Transcript_7816/g.14036 Transcript_7816/m.14036 type:complete len:337 (+) Transcript_7816:94-1104(+)
MKKGFLADESVSGVQSNGVLPSDAAGSSSGALAEVKVSIAPPTPPGDDYPKFVSVLQHKKPGIVGLDGQPALCEYHILGTAHVSKESCEDVRKVIRRVKPDVVMLELCNGRSGLLHSQAKTEVPSLSKMMEEYQSGKTPLMGVVYSWLLARIGENMEVFPGEEFRVALQEARAIGANVDLGDRPVRITLVRTWAALSLWQKVKFVWCLVYSGINVPDAEELSRMVEEMKETDITTEAIMELGREFPSLLEPLIYERDRYMVHRLRLLSKQASKVVAVVGAGHLPGIRENWEKEIDVQEVMWMPQPRQRSVLLSWRALTVVAGCTTAAMVYLRYKSR